MNSQVLLFGRPRLPIVSMGQWQTATHPGFQAWRPSIMTVTESPFVPSTVISTANTSTSKASIFGKVGIIALALGIAGVGAYAILRKKKPTDKKPALRKQIESKPTAAKPQVKKAAERDKTVGWLSTVKRQEGNVPLGVYPSQEEAFLAGWKNLYDRPQYIPSPAIVVNQVVEDEGEEKLRAPYSYLGMPLIIDEKKRLDRRREYRPFRAAA